MIKNILGAVAAVAMAVTPAAARVDAGTVALLETIDASDINLQVDSSGVNKTLLLWVSIAHVDFNVS